MAKSRAGGGINSRQVVHRPHGKTEPRANKYRPQGVSQLGQMQGSHITHDKESSYRGEPKRGGPGYNPPLGITDPVKAVGVGGGRTIYKTGSQCQTGTNPGNPRPNTRRQALEQE
jgi:hypothetical protein